MVFGVDIKTHLKRGSTFASSFAVLSDILTVIFIAI
jgi:hypothetical protein